MSNQMANPVSIHLREETKNSSSTPEDVRHRQNGNRLDLYRAAVTGGWERALEIFSRDGYEAMTARVNAEGMTALHVAANCGRSQFVLNLVALLDEDDLAITDQLGRNVLHHVALASSVDAAKAILDKNSVLAMSKDEKDYTPLYYAAKWRHRSLCKEMVQFLYDKSTDVSVFQNDTAPDLIVAIADSGAHDIVLNILKDKNPKLALRSNSEGLTILHIIASQPQVFIDDDDQLPIERIKAKFYARMNIVSKEEKEHNDAEQLIRFICDKLQSKQSDSEIMDFFLPPAGKPAILNVATANGVFKLVKICLKCFPDLIWYSSSYGSKKLLIHVAVEERQKKIFKYVRVLIGKNTGSYASTADEDGNNILHLAAKLAPIPRLQSVPGPAFQMQSEFRWFKEVGELVYREEMVAKNKAKKTPLELFYDEHSKLMEDAKEWIKDTSNSCMVVAALVATVAFASMITVPGGTKSETGKPVLASKAVFIMFSVSNALSMISSAVALLMFLALQTSRFTTDDFLEKLPLNMLRGLLALFVAVATMMIAFGTAIGIALQTRVRWAYIPITVVACFPAIIFFRLQLPLLFQTLGFTKRSKGLMPL